MDPDILVQTMTPEVYERLKESVETGKWLDGNPLSEEQRETCMQAVIIYQAKHLDNKQHMTVSADGEVIHLSRQELKQQLNTQTQDDAPQEIARFKQDDF